MQIKNHLLILDNGKQAVLKPTPNKGGKYTPQYLVMHYTAATTASSAINWFLSTAAQASAHLVIAPDGAVTQCAPFNIVTWHAGSSTWKGLTGLNQFSIGIEIVNAGRLARKGDKWICPVDRATIPDDDVVMATHRNETQIAAWHEYTAKQLDVSLKIAVTLVSHYGLKDVLSHDEIAPMRKSDPGPAFPMASFRSKSMGRKDETLDQYVTADKLNIRSGAGTQFAPVTDAPLPKGTPVLVLKTEGNWSFVDVQTTVKGQMDLEGWVSSKFLVKK